MCVYVCLVWEGPWISKFFHVEHWSPPDKARGLGFELAVWITCWVPRGAVSLNLYVPLVCQVSHGFFFFCCFLVTFFLNFKYTHTSTTVVISGNNTQYWWWWTLKEHGPMGMKKKKKGGQKENVATNNKNWTMHYCYALSRETNVHVNTTKKSKKKREWEKNCHIKLEMHTLSPQWDICCVSHAI